MQHTFLIAMDFIRTIVLTVVEVVAAKDGADATAIGALELIFLTYWRGRSRFWGSHREQIILIIKNMLSKYIPIPGFTSHLIACSIKRIGNANRKPVKLTAVDFVTVVPTVVDTITVF